MINIVFCGFPDDIQHKTKEMDINVRKQMLKNGGKFVCTNVNIVEEINHAYDFYICNITKEEDLAAIYKKRNQFAFGDIIIVSRTADFALMGYEYSAIGYVLMPLHWYSLERLLEIMYRKIKKNILTVCTPTGIQRFQASSFLYANIEGRSICYHLKTRNVQGTVLRHSFKEQVSTDLLSDNASFLFLEPSLIVNISQITRVGVDDSVIEFDDVIYPISKRQKDKVIAALLAR